MNKEKVYMIFKDENGKYKVGITHKNQNGEYENAYFPVRFKKEVNLENQTKIKIKNYWLDFYNWEYNEKKGTTFYIFISEFEKITDIPVEQLTTKTDFDTKGQIQIDDKDLPF